MTHREYTLDELARPRWRQIVDRATDGGAPRFVLAALAVVMTLSIAGSAVGARKNHQLRSQLLAAQKVEIDKTPEATRKLLPRIDQLVQAQAQAKSHPAGAFIAPRLKQPGALASLLSSEGLYFRAVTTEIPTTEAVHVAAGKSVRDAVPMCMLRDSEGASLRERVEQSCEPGAGCVGYKLSRVHNVRQVVPGLRVLSEGWTETASQADELGLGLLRQDLADRTTAGEIDAARSIAQKASYLLVVLDDVPGDLPEQFWGSRRDLVQTADHQARVGLYDVRSGEQLVRLTLPVSVETPLAAGAPDAVRRQMLSCQLGLDIREALDESVNR